MSVSTFGKFWEKSSIIFKVMVVMMFMVPIGVSNFVGASMIAEENTDDNTIIIENTIDDSNAKDKVLFSVDDKNSDKDLTLYSANPLLIDSTIIPK